MFLFTPSIDLDYKEPLSHYPHNLQYCTSRSLYLALHLCAGNQTPMFFKQPDFSCPSIELKLNYISSYSITKEFMSSVFKRIILLQRCNILKCTIVVKIMKFEK